MKIKTLTAILSSALLILSFSNAQLVISQYAEEGNIKGIEIWNPTTSDVVFSEENTLTIDQYTNGSTTPSTKFTQTSGTIAAGQVAVYADGSVNSIWNNITFSEVNFNFNGDDAISISLGGTVIDVFGTIGEDPGSSWSGNSVSTADQNIALKTAIITGSTGWSDPSSRFETIANKPLDSTATDAVNLSGFGVAPALSGDTGGGDTGGGDTGGGDTGGGDTGGGDTGGGDTGGGDTGGGDTGGGDTGGGDTGGGDTGGGDTGGGDTGGGDTGGGDTGGDDTGGGDTGGGLIISQYIETDSGTSPKGIELWNTTGDTIDFAVTPLTVYAARAASGSIGAFGSSTSANDTFTLNTGTLPDNAVMVIGSADMGTYLTGLSNVLYINVYFHLHTWYFNGDDALQVQLNGVVQDTFGQDNVADPGTTWGTDATVITKDLNLALKAGITAGDVDGWSDPTERFEVVVDSSGSAVAPNATDGLTGFGLAPTGSDNTGGGDTGGGDTGGGDTGGGDTGGGDTGGGDTGGGDTGGGDTGGGDTGGGDTGGGDTGGGDTGGGDTGSGDAVGGLIISQYIETDSGTKPKGIELWNTTGDTIDFAVTPLDIFIGYNGGALGGSSNTSIFNLVTGTLAAGEAMVIGTSDMETYMTSNYPSVLYELKAWNFNGNDALQIQLNGVVQDTFGNPGESAYWTGVEDSTVITRNLNIALKTGILTGDIDGWSDPSLRFEVVADSSGASVSPTGADGLTGFGVAPTLPPDPTVDTDGDSYYDDVDVFPYDPTEWSDADEDGVGDNSDAFPDDPNESADADSDGVGDNADAFDDDATESADTDGDGVGDNSDVYEGYDDAVIGSFLTDFPQSGGGGLTQQDLLDARVGSTAVSVTDGTATITIQVEQSDDNMATWTTPSEGATSVDLPVTGDASFFRVRAQ